MDASEIKIGLITCYNKMSRIYKERAELLMVGNLDAIKMTNNYGEEVKCNKEIDDYWKSLEELDNEA